LPIKHTFSSRKYFHKFLTIETHFGGKMLDKAQSLADELVRLRRDIHQHPELGFEEFRTAALVADTLTELGIATQTGVGRTGVVGQIGSGNGPTIAIRADMDALPILEKTAVSYTSQNDGIMHACGHDAHTAILLGAAHLLQQSFLTEKWQGNVRLLFQPSEERFDENGISGATAMIADRALEGIDAVIALHVWSDKTSGKVWVYDGAYPHTGSDPLFMLGPILNALYAIPSRQINPLKPSVVSLGKICGGAIHNVIPKEVFLQGTIRSHDEAVRTQLWHEIERALSLSKPLGGD
jgi:amidohydrolase